VEQRVWQLVAATVDELRSEVDEVVCLAMPEWFGAIGALYLDFRQLSDDEVRSLLERAKPRAEESPRVEAP
jgi:predicted phosphoribosyltransferase